MSTETIIKVELATSEALYKGAMAIRKQVFVKEQRIPESKEFDGNDFCAAHVVAYVQKNNRRLPIGTMRIRFFSDFVKFERMAVIRNFRKTNVAEDIMQYGLKYVAEKGYRQVYGMCKQELLPRWQQCGYHEIPGAERIEQNGMVLIPISLDLKENPQAIKMTSHPSLLTALEILGVVGLKLFSRRKSLFNLALFSGGFALSYLFLYFSLAYLDMSIAYAAWMGLGTAGAVIINMVFFGESRKMSRIVGVGLIVIGVVGLKMVS